MWWKLSGTNREYTSGRVVRAKGLWRSEIAPKRVRIPPYLNAKYMIWFIVSFCILTPGNLVRLQRSPISSIGKGQAHSRNLAIVCCCFYISTNALPGFVYIPVLFYFDVIGFQKRRRNILITMRVFILFLMCVSRPAIRVRGRAFLDPAGLVPSGPEFKFGGGGEEVMGAIQ